MQGFIVYVLIISFISPCLCIRFNVETTNDTSYNVMQYGAIGNGISDDTQAFSKAWSSACNAGGISTLVIPSQKSFLVTKVNFSGPCNSEIHIQLEGKIVAPSKEKWEAGPYLMNIKHLNGLTIDGNSVGEIDGNGSTWWDCSGCDRPGVFHFHKCDNLTVSNLKITNSPRSHVSINECNVTTFTNIFINAPALSPNTDGFDISASIHILIQDSHIESGDDCIAINSGSSFINAQRLICGPGGHGISVGSLGKHGANDEVSNIYVQNCTFKNTTNGARIKTFSGGSGYARNITYEQIILENVTNPIIINQEYNSYLEETSVSVSSVTFRGFNGTYAGKVAINLDCSSSGCFDIHLDHNNIVPAQEEGIKNALVLCKNAHGTANDTIPNVPCLSK